MNYTKEQFQALAPYADNFRTAIEGEWSRRIPVDGQKLIRKTYEDATKTRIPFNSGCQLCLLNLLKRAGRLWFADKKEMAARDAKAIEALENADPAQVAQVVGAEAEEAPAPEAPQDGLIKLKEGADVGALAKELEENFVPDSTNTLISVKETAKISTRKPGKGNGAGRSNKGRKSAKK